MGLTNFPNGISSFGMPVVGMTTGNVFFVDSGATGTGSDTAAAGRGADNPFLTIDYAIGQCTANNGDVIYVMPGHTENLTAAITMDVAGVTVMGLGSGFTRPRLVYTGTGGLVSIIASNCRWSNIVHDASIAAVVSAIAVSGPGTAVATQHTEIDNCRFTFDATGIEFTVMVALGDGAANSADYVSLHDNWFEAENIDGCASALLIDDCQFIHIRNNYFSGDFSSACIDGAAGSSACLDYLVADNYIINADDGTSNCIDLDDNATGMVTNNRMAHAGATPEAGFDVGACKSTENYVNDTAVDTSGELTPVAVAT